MATPAREIGLSSTSGLLPARPDTGDALATRLLLAQHIAELENIKTVESAIHTVPRTVEVYVQPPAVSLRRQRPAALLCTISHDTIIVCGFDAGSHAQAVECSDSPGGIRLLMPTNVDELTLCWEIIRQAHARLVESTAAATPQRTKAWPDNLPRFSRTTLQ